MKPAQDEASSTHSAHSQPSQVTEVSNPPEAAPKENPDSSTAETTPVHKSSAASKAAAFFTSGKMSSSSTDLKKTKAAPDGPDCKFNLFSQCLKIGCYALYLG